MPGRRCFLDMPITTPPERVAQYGGDTDHFTHVRDFLFAPAVRRAGLEPYGPHVAGADLMHAEIYQTLDEADLVLVDMSGANPNVAIELGYRLRSGRPVVLVCDDRTGALPFDVSILNCHRYRAGLEVWHLANEIAALRDHVMVTVDRSLGGNAVGRYFGNGLAGERAGAWLDHVPVQTPRNERVGSLRR